jgi:23S rRNA pseudouridine1911/1915/1917 synthase
MNNSTDKLTIIYNDETPIRIDKYISGLNVPELYSRTLIEKLISENKVLVNGKPEKKNYKLVQNDEIIITLPEPEASELRPSDIPLEIIYEDEYLAVINKPSGIVVHPGIGNKENTIANALTYHFKSALSEGTDKFRPGIVHRLDKDTSGLLIIAKDNKTHYLLRNMFQDKKITKYYRAICVGRPKEPTGTIESFIERDKKNPRRMRVSETGRWSITHYEILKYYHFFTYLNINLETGRTHQIRVHLSRANLPIFGDRIYNSLEITASHIPSEKKRALDHFLNHRLPYQALHAFRLEFIHPITGKELILEAPLPPHFKNALKWLDDNFSLEDL